MFLIVFIAFLVVTLAYRDLPPGIQLYNSLGIPETAYPVVGIPTTTLVCAGFNGVVYGVIAWLIYTFVEKARKKRQTQESGPKTAPSS
mgnify:FL=1